MERILRQLEAIGENLEHSCLKIIIESGLPSWVLDKVSQTKKILGITWNPRNDSIEILSRPWNNQTPTKRTILQFTASQHDPLGFLIPSVLIFKSFLQNLSKKKLSRDQPVKNEDLTTWHELTNQWPTKVKEIPRTIIDSDCLQQLKIRVFTDVSPIAYAAAIYAKQGTKTSLIFMKSRIAPMEDMTIPKLVLLAILIGVRALQFVIKQLELETTKVTLWSDSRCALHWIKNQTRSYPHSSKTELKK
ncbi:unnamed protein product [Acanthocheilonema viteae]|uniref:Uncharacterized protein n=1 Tax=Acanthocheilonema viteae TaxID=6277 RepID=A0A498SX41_ACAVI|nr:unnamed protein product [Acanthocheilonema viteae]